MLGHFSPHSNIPLPSLTSNSHRPTFFSSEIAMRCGRIAVEGDAEELQSPKGSSKNRHRRRNPWSGRGTEIFEMISAELSRKRAAVARRTGAPENTVRFVATDHGWTAVLPRHIMSTFPAAEPRQKTTSSEAARSTHEVTQVFVPWKKRLAVAACYWSGGILSMRRFISFTVNFVSAVCRSPVLDILGAPEHGTDDNKTENPCSVETFTAPRKAASGPLGVLREEKRTQDDNFVEKKKPKKIYRRFQSLDDRLVRRRESYAVSSDSYLRFLSPCSRQISEFDLILGGIVLMVILFALAFFGRVCAVACNTACWYAIPVAKEHMVRHSKKMRRRVRFAAPRRLDDVEEEES